MPNQMDGASFAVALMHGESSIVRTTTTNAVVENFVLLVSGARHATLKITRMR
jgi:hypothetical protein